MRLVKLSAEDHRSIELLLTPSWLSGLVAVVIGLSISIGVIVAFETHNSVVQQQLMSWQQSQPTPELVTPSQPSAPHNSSLRSDWSLLALWSLAGVVVYIIAAYIVHSFTRAEELRESLNYVHASRHKMLASTAKHALLRIIASVIFIIFAVGFVKQIIPYSILASHASASNLSSVDSGLYTLMSFAIIALCLHIETILLRLSLGRSRVFSGS